MSTAHWISCSTKGCGLRYTTWHDSLQDFAADATAQGWQLSPPLCPDCAYQGSVDPASERILVVPLTRGAFTAYAPDHMTAADWALVASVCGAMATQTDTNGDG